MINKRRNIIQGKDFCLHYLHKTVGSRGEGIARALESDIDLMIDYEDRICLENSEIPASCLNVPNIFQMKELKKNPGYCKLYKLKEGEQRFEELTTLYLASLFRQVNLSLIQLISWNENCKKELVGPAVKVSSLNKFTFDFVGTFKIYSPSSLHRWCKRQRNHDWPSAATLQKISKMNGNLVATGNKFSSTKNIEWRICFNEAELLLITTFNETQYQLYVLLRMINKTLLKKCKVTSYMLKNIVFWLSEETPQAAFIPRYLFSLTFKALSRLRKASREKCLRYYMFPERNLLMEKLTVDGSNYLKRELDKLIKMEFQLFDKIRLDKIEIVKKMSYSEANLLQEICDELEKNLESIHLRILELFSKKSSSDDINNDKMIKEFRAEMKAIADRGGPIQIVGQTNTDVCRLFLR